MTNPIPSSSLDFLAHFEKLRKSIELFHALFPLLMQAFWREDGHAGEVLSMCGTLSNLYHNDDHPVVGVFDHSNGDSDPAMMAVMGAPGLRNKTVSDIFARILCRFRKQRIVNSSNWNLGSYRQRADKTTSTYHIMHLIFNSQTSRVKVTSYFKTHVKKHNKTKTITLYSFTQFNLNNPT